MGTTILQNGSVITPEGVLSGHDVVIRDRRIEEIRETRPAPNDVRIIDCTGAWISPGFIDVHSDYIEHMAAPRPTSLMDFPTSLREAERELVTHGITTMYHSLSFYGQGSPFGPNPVRSPENSRKLIEAIHGVHESEHLIRHRFHARFEVDNVDRVEELEDLIETGRIHLLSFMDHSPGQGQYRDLEVYKLVLKGYRNLSSAEAESEIETTRGRAKINHETLSTLAALARARGIAVASHDDDTVEKLDVVQEWGASISEFPITLEVAREAKRRGLRTVGGAPNVLLGGSHSGNLSAAEAALDGSLDVLCSDYYPASLLHGVFLLHRRHGLNLAEAFRLATLNPALAVGLDDLGSVEAGKLADLLVIRTLQDGFPVVTEAFVDGRSLLSLEYRV